MNRNKKKGTEAETDVVNFLLSFPDYFPNAERRAQTGGKDKGDITGIPSTVIQVKNVETLNLAKAQRDTLTQRTNANADNCLLVVKRPYKPVHRWDAWVPARQLGYPSNFLPEGEQWVRMDLALAVAFLALQVNL